MRFPAVSRPSIPVFSWVFGAALVLAGSSATAGDNSWTECGPEASIESVVLNPADAMIAYAGAKVSGTYQGHGVFKSWDSGTTWSLLVGTEEAGPIVAVDPLASDTVYTTSSNWGILKSGNGGGIWLEVWQGQSGRRIGAIEIDRHRSGTLYVVIEEHYYDAYRSDDGGQTWVELALPDDAAVAGIYSDPHTPGVVYSATVDRLFKSSDYGESWVSISTGLETPPEYRVWVGGDYYPVTHLDFDPTDPQLMYASTMVGPYRTRNGGLSWKPARSGMTICCDFVSSDECDDLKISGPSSCEAWLQGFAIDPYQPSTVYATTSLGTYRSYDRGDRWRQITGPDETNPESIVAVGGGLLLGASDEVGVLRLQTSPAPSPRHPSRRVVPAATARRTPLPKRDLD